MKKVFSENDIPEIAQEVLAYIVKKANTKGATVVALSGDLGAGKTTLTKEIGRLLGVKKTVISPTFVLLKSYPIKHTPWKTFHHIDAYRFDKPEEVLKIGWSELIQDPKHLVFVEWPEKIGSMVPEDIITIFLKHAPKEKRHIEIKKAPSKK